MNALIFICLVVAGAYTGSYLAGSAHATLGFWLGALVAAAGLFVLIRRDRANTAEYIEALRRGERPAMPPWVPAALFAIAVVKVVVFVGVCIFPVVFLEFVSAKGLRVAAPWYGALLAGAFWAINDVKMAPLEEASSGRTVWMVRGLVGLGALAGVTRVFLLMSLARDDAAAIAALAFVLFFMWSIAAAIVFVGAPAFLSEPLARLIQAPFSTLAKEIGRRSDRRMKRR